MENKMLRLKNTVFTKTGWELVEDSFDETQLITTGSNFMIGNGYLGYRGTFSEWRKNNYTACILTDTYDMADGKWRELCNVPNTLYAAFYVDGEQCSYDNGNYLEYERGLNLKSGIYFRNFTWQTPQNKKMKVHIEKISSYDNLHSLLMKCKITAEDDFVLEFIEGIDGDVWSINGDHFKSQEVKEEDSVLLIKSETVEESIEIICSSQTELSEKQLVDETLIKESNAIFKKRKLNLKKGDRFELVKYSSIYSSNDVSDPFNSSISDIKSNLKSGYDLLKQKHIKKWEEIWNISDIVIEGDLESQVLLRFNLYHNIIATPAHSDHLPIGARGLSCQAYQGAAFWDEEIFNMPMFLYTRPEIARNILMYRYKTIQGAKEKAKKLGYEGAFYAWISGKTGKELCPSFFFKDVLTGRKIRNHFNDWQIHVSPDIVYAISKYYEVTNDFDFIENYGAEIVFEVAKFLYSRAFYNMRKDRYEFIRLLGPDEYHENVDNNAFTNYQASYALDVACSIYEKLSEDVLKSLKDKVGFTAEDVSNWKTMSKKVFQKRPDKNNIVEQFDGYFDLEDTTPSEIKKRLLDPGEYHGWPNGIAVHTQVLKQADVVQMFVMHDDFSREVMKANYDYYEKRTEHGSSLSPSAYSIIAAKVGYVEKAYEYFKNSVGIDVFNTNKAVSGGTFIGGIHTASSGAAWLMMVKGFAGLEIKNGVITLNPNLPDNWTEIAFNFVYMGKKININISKAIINLNSKSLNSVKIKFNNEIKELKNKKIEFASK